MAQVFVEDTFHLCSVAGTAVQPNSKNVTFQDHPKDPKVCFVQMPGRFFPAAGLASVRFFFFRYTFNPITLHLQVPAQKVFGPSKPTPNTFSEGTWRPRVRSIHQFRYLSP